MPDESIDLVVTSPPYPMIEMWDESFAVQDPEIGACLAFCDGAGAFSHMHQLLDKTWKECFRLLKPGSFLCINIGDATRKLGDNFQLYPNHARIITACETLGFQSLPLILWRKQTNAPNKFMGSGMLPGGAYVTLEHEYILIFRKGDKKSYVSPAEKKRRRQSSYFWEERNIWFSDIWDFKGIRQTLAKSSGRKRSAAFPLELPFRLINMYSLIGDTVLDPFLGTGTTALAAAACGRNSIGIELDRKLAAEFKSAVRRCKTELNQRIKERIEQHIASAELLRKKGKCRYTNNIYGFPVMTLQEEDITLYKIDDISSWERDSFNVQYSPADNFKLRFFTD